MRRFVGSPFLLCGFSAVLGACSPSNTGSPDSGSPDSGSRDATTMLCIPGASIACVGTGGCAGGQVCNPDGASLGPCECAAPAQDAGAGEGSPPDARADGGATTPDAAADATILDGAGTDADGGLEAGSGDASTVVSCPNGTTTTVSGKVYDPAGKNPVYDVSVYVPDGPLPVLPKGVPTGAGACSCSALFPGRTFASTKTGVDGAFTLTNVPAGANIPLVLQIGKWRRVVPVNVTACQPNAQPDRSLALPASVAPGATDDNLPDIAVSTGGADTLECLFSRMGLAKEEFVAGADRGGHVHIFAGGNPASGGHGAVGVPQSPAFPGAPASDATLWSTPVQLMPYDVTLLSCEGGETYDANPAALETYLNAGGRVFASHEHYPWFAGPIASGQSYAAPSDWGVNLATWTASASSNPGVIGGVVQTTLNGSSTPFPKGLAFEQWLANVGALGQGGVPSNELSIYQPRYSSVVGPQNKPSQAWLASDSQASLSGETMAFSFDTPVNLAGGGGTTACGRAIYSDLHVEGSPSTTDSPPAPGGCANVDLSPQEKALEFMVFDLSGCVVPDSATP